MGKLEDVMPDELKKRAVVLGTELILPYAEALSAVEVATKHQVAVLGLESFEFRKEGMVTVSYTGYDVPFTGDWKAYVTATNALADQWVKEHPLGANHGYILTSTSEGECADLSKLRNEKSR